MYKAVKALDWPSFFAVDRTLRDGLDVIATTDHDAGKLLGRTSAGTVRLEKDPRGLRVDIDLPKTTLGNDVLELVSLDAGARELIPTGQVARRVSLVSRLMRSSDLAYREAGSCLRRGGGSMIRRAPPP